MPKRSILIALLCLLPLSAGAQGFVKNVWDRINAPNPKLDSVYIFQHKKGWIVGTGYKLIQNTAEIDSKEIMGIKGEGMAQHELDLRLEPNIAHKVGASVGYGGLKLTYYQTVARIGDKGHSAGFTWNSNSFAITARYQDYTSTPYGLFTIKPIDNPDDIKEYDHEGEKSAKVRNVFVSGLYAFNGKRFSYKAAYNGGVTQRKSAGAFILSLKYMYGSVALDPEEDVFLNFLSGIGRYQTHQASLGAGYSFNWVPYHRDAVSATNLHGLRNLCINVTLVPMVTLFNMTITQEYERASDQPNKFDDDIANEFKIVGNIEPNFTVRAGINYAIGHLYMNALGEFGYLFFRTPSKDFTRKGDNGIITLSQYGKFVLWSVTFQLNYRF